MSFDLTDEEGVFLVKLARKAIVEYLKTHRKIRSPQETPEKLKARCGVFVTLNKLEERGKSLRGEILNFETIPEWHGGQVAAAVTGFPGWKGFVDGRRQDVKGLKLTSRTRLLVIYVPKGGHEVWMVYHPGSFIVGMFLGLMGMAFFLGLRTTSLVEAG